MSFLYIKIHPPRHLSKCKASKVTQFLKDAIFTGERKNMKQSKSSGRTWLNKPWSFVPRNITSSLQIRICELNRHTGNLHKIATEVENTNWVTSILTKKEITACI